MRTSFRGWAKAEYGARFEAIELALAHAIGTSVTQAYDREDLLEERRGMMQAWADYVGTRCHSRATHRPIACGFFRPRWVGMTAPLTCPGRFSFAL